MINQYVVHPFKDVVDKVSIVTRELGMPLLDENMKISLFSKEDAEEYCFKLNQTHAVDLAVKGIENMKPKEDLSQLFQTIFSRLGSELISHLADKWISGVDFFTFYLNLDSKAKRCLLEYFGIKVEADKFPDHSTCSIKIIEGMKRCEVFPYEMETLHEFCLFGNNHSLNVLKKIDPSEEAWKVVKENNINPYGNCANWCAWWKNASLEDHYTLMEYIKNH